MDLTRKTVSLSDLVNTQMSPIVSVNRCSNGHSATARDITGVIFSEDRKMSRIFDAESNGNIAGQRLGLFEQVIPTLEPDGDIFIGLDIYQE